MNCCKKCECVCFGRNYANILNDAVDENNNLKAELSMVITILHFSGRYITKLSCIRKCFFFFLNDSELYRFVVLSKTSINKILNCV